MARQSAGARWMSLARTVAIAAALSGFYLMLLHLRH